MVPKFRAWDKHVKKIRKVTEIHFDDSLIYLKANNGKGYYCSFSDIELMQSTGLKDKNGVEIFEGDVLTSNVQPCKMVNPIKDGYGVVRFENGMFKLGAISLVTFISKMEVIGNIYENPELLEKANES
ncbi:YopX family protein [Enterococcus casseliflavus]|uniref:YopX family protein n=1 Tax=Enterococcus casseliflavus TaxID=37734 RepID=UPI003D0C21B5